MSFLSSIVSFIQTITKLAKVLESHKRGEKSNQGNRIKKANKKACDYSIFGSTSISLRYRGTIPSQWPSSSRCRDKRNDNRQELWWHRYLNKIRRTHAYRLSRPVLYHRQDKEGSVSLTLLSILRRMYIWETISTRWKWRMLVFKNDWLERRWCQTHLSEKQLQRSQLSLCPSLLVRLFKHTVQQHGL